MSLKVKDLLIVVTISILSVFTVKICTKDSSACVNISENTIDQTVSKTQMQFGIPVDNYEISKVRIRYNQHLSSILTTYNLKDYSEEDIVREVRDVFDLRKFKARNYVNIFLSKDSTKSLEHLVYEHTLTDFIKISLIDSIYVEWIEKKIDTLHRSVSGEVKTSLWEAMIESNANPHLAVELSDIYAWTIDFFGLSTGDKFKVIYDELYVDSVSIGVGQIYSAKFTHNGTEYYGFAFNQNGIDGYYDEKGKSLKKAFLKAPLRFRRISSGFSYSRYHPILKIRRPHRGIDYAAPTGTPIVSIGEGKVIAKGYTKAAGYYIKIKHNGTYTSGYNHLSKYGKGMRVGAHVNQGQVIGYVGSTGYATGPHLDFRIWKNGRLANPLYIKAPPVEPVTDENLANFEKIRNVLTNLLDHI
ncbi:M23 family metallopeptidase [Bacteroidota bacterium]